MERTILPCRMCDRLVSNNYSHPCFGILSSKERQ